MCDASPLTLWQFAWRLRASSAALVLLLSGCSSINRETHYIKAVDGMGYPVNYYRISVHGRTMMSSSRYLSGYFPDDAVDIYFGQIPQPADGTFIKVKSATNGADTGANGTNAGAATNGETAAAPATSSNRLSTAPAPGTKLVLLLSSRAETVATQISDIARNEELMRNITKLIHRDEFEAAQRASYSQQTTRSRLDALVTIAGSSIQQLPDDANAETATAKLLLFCNQVAFQFGNRVPFTTLQEAANWYEQNRDTLVGRAPR